MKKQNSTPCGVYNLRNLSATKPAYTTPIRPTQQKDRGTVRVVSQLSPTREATSVTNSFMALTNKWPDVDECFPLLFRCFHDANQSGGALVRLPLTALIGVCLCNVENRIWSTLLQRSPRPRMLRNLCKCILGRIERGMPRGEGCNKQKMQQGKRERKKKYCILLSFIFTRCVSFRFTQNAFQ